VTTGGEEGDDRCGEGSRRGANDAAYFAEEEREAARNNYTRIRGGLITWRARARADKRGGHVEIQFPAFPSTRLSADINFGDAHCAVRRVPASSKPRRHLN